MCRLTEQQDLLKVVQDFVARFKESATSIASFGVALLCEASPVCKDAHLTALLMDRIHVPLRLVSMSLERTFKRI